MRIIGGLSNWRRDRVRLREIAESCYVGDELISKECFESTLDVSEIWVACWEAGDWAPYPEFKTENPIIGFIAVEDNVGPYIWNVAVDPLFQGRGIGGNLLREVCQWATANKRNSMRLEVNAKNPAQKLYFDYGFRVKAVVPQLYGLEDGLSMVRKFNHE